MSKKMAASTEGVSISVTNGVARLVLDRPAKKNAITLNMWRGLAETFHALAMDTDVRVAILSGSGADFSAGADIAEFATVRRNAETARAYEAANSDAFASVRNAPFPTIAAISGICFGGAFGLAAAADLRIATKDATFAVPAARLGLAYPQDAMIDIVANAGLQMAKYLTFTGATAGAEEAHATGFLLELVEPCDLEARAETLARQIAANAPLSVRASKAAIGAVVTGKDEDASRARALGDMTFDSADYAEGRTAFVERRRPVFRGR